jgi:hypothetical protein
LAVVADFRPDIVAHLAAISIVRMVMRRKFTGGRRWYA